MSEQIEAVILEGPTVNVTARAPLRVDPRSLAVAASIRVFERYPVLTRVTLTVGEAQVSVSRAEIVRLLGPEGFAPLREPARYRQVLAEALRAPATEATE